MSQQSKRRRRPSAAWTPARQRVSKSEVRGQRRIRGPHKLPQSIAFAVPDDGNQAPDSFARHLDHRNMHRLRSAPRATLPSAGEHGSQVGAAWHPAGELPRPGDAPVQPLLARTHARLQPSPRKLRAAAPLGWLRLLCARRKIERIGVSPLAHRPGARHRPRRPAGCWRPTAR